MAKQRKHNFVIGYRYDGAVVYGKNENNRTSSAIPLTLFQVKRKVKPMTCAGMAIFELVELNNGKT